MGKSAEELNTDLESSRQQLSRNIDELNDKVNPQRVIRRRKDAAVSGMGSLRDRVMGTASDTRDRASSAAGNTVAGATETASQAAQGAVGTIEHRTQGSPLAAGLVAFGAGMLVSALVPASDKEADAVQRAVDAAREHGQASDGGSQERRPRHRRQPQGVGRRPSPGGQVLGAGVGRDSQA
jgi:ElaB/YqjD/DUF883 family membrane-anchored ribosome-binding protein